MNEESPRKSLVKGERFVRHDDTSEVSILQRWRVGTPANSNTALPAIAATLSHADKKCLTRTTLEHTKKRENWIVE